MNKISHITQVRVRYADTDKMGIVYNGNYFTYFEIGRTELMRHFGLPYVNFEEQGYLLPLTEAKAEYKYPAKYDDILDVYSEIIYENKPLVKFNYEIKTNGTLITKGYTVHTFVNKETLKPVRPPKIFLKFIEDLKQVEHL